MAKKNVKTTGKKKGTGSSPQKRKTVTDPYTGEKKYPIEDSEKFVEVIPQEPRDRKGENYLLNEETSMDHYTADANTDSVADQMSGFTEDEEIESDFTERQSLASGGRKELEEELDKHNSKSPFLTGGDLDASWETSDQAGEEAVGGSVSTPDKDRVEEIGQAAGLTYEDNEPLDYDKVRERDKKRWELNPASSLELNQELEDVLEDIEEDEEEHSSEEKTRDEE